MSLPFHPPALARRLTSLGARGVLVLAGLAMATTAWAALKSSTKFTLKELEEEPEMSPKQFANLFENFRFSFSPYVLPVENFLRAQAGDCDDYAVLAGHVLAKKGNRTRVIRVALAGTDFSHAICYVMENKAYLDFNNRKYSMNLAKAGPTIRQIAEKVADSMEKNWTSATEYTFSYADYRKVTRFTVVKTDPPAKDPDRQAAN
jgi:hypothetical protein